MSSSSSANPEAELSASKKRKRGHPVLITLGVLLLLVMVAAGVGVWYISTPEFADKVRLRVIAELESATGGRVELRAFRWELRHLEFEADGLTIHGLESPGEVPYAHVEKLRIRLKLLSLLHPSAHLDLLAAESPVVHIIVYPDGSTNQPKPKRAAGNLNDTINTIFDLQANRVTAGNGVFLLNQKALPFNLAADDVAVLVRYVGATGRYDASVEITDLTTQFKREAQVHSHLQADLELGRDMAQIRQLLWMTKRSDVHITGVVRSYASPIIDAHLVGSADLRDVGFLTAQDELAGGVASFDLTAQMKSASDFHADGSLMLKKGAYHDQYLDLQDVDLTTPVHLTPQEISLPDARIRVLSGGMKAQFHYYNWLNAPRKQGRSGWEQDGAGSAAANSGKGSRAALESGDRGGKEEGAGCDAAGAILSRSVAHGAGGCVAGGVDEEI